MPEYPDFIEQLSHTDPTLFELVARQHDLVLGAEGVDSKITLLIMLAVDAFAGSSGVAPLAALARRNGASEVEIGQAVRIASHVAGNRVLASAAAAFSAEAMPA